MTRPVNAKWNGHAFEPHGDYHLRIAAADYEDGRIYRIAPVEDRSYKSHNHYFACVSEAWKNLPEEYAMEPWAQSPEHLRKYALIRTGFCSCIETALATQSDAAAVANVLRVSDPYCVAVAEQNAVRFYRAKSQRMRAMEKEEFQQSKDAVLDFLSKLIGTDTTTLQQQAGQAA